MRNVLVVLALVGTVAMAQQPANPRQQPGASITMFAPEQHDLYDGHYILAANRIYMVGGLNDPVGWDHMDNDAKAVKPVAGTAEIDVNDLTNTGKFGARLKIPEGDLVLAIDTFNEFNPCQNGGIVGQFQYLASKLDGMPEGDGTVLDNSCLMFLSSLFVGRTHDNNRLPVLLAGGLGGSLETGRSLNYLGQPAENRKMCSLYLSLMDRMGVQLDHFGDADSRLARL